MNKALRCLETPSFGSQIKGLTNPDVLNRHLNIWNAKFMTSLPKNVTV